MAHVVLGYPTPEYSVHIAETLADGGVGALELQIPFNDPTADGALIEEASYVALTHRMSTDDYIELAHRIALTVKIPCYCMTYITIPFYKGIAQFVEKIARAGMRGIIIPDLPFDNDENMYTCCRAYDITHVVVGTIAVASRRFRAILEIPQRTVYMALRAGITGRETMLSAEHIARLRQLHSRGKRVFAGFGVRSHTQIAQIAPYVQYIAIGSHFIRAIKEGMDAHYEMSGYEQAIRSAMDALVDPKSPDDFSV